MEDKKIKLISRRDFLKLAGLTGAGVTAGHLFFSDLMAVPRELLDNLTRKTGQETWINTVCGQCPGGCGIIVRLIDGIPVYVRGNPHYPVNRGGVCPMAHTSMEVLFNPDRVRNPSIQTGPRGGGRFKEIDWKEALTGFNRRLQDLISGGEGHKIAMITGDRSLLGRELSKYWMRAVGSPNYFEDETLIENTACVQMCQGINVTPAYDLLNTKYILNFGNNFFEEGSSPLYFQQVFGRLRSERKATRAELIHIDSRINLTASNSDRWIPIRPGTYGALALGIAHVLIADELYDKDYITNHTFGFGPFKDKDGRDHPGFESFTRENYYPGKVSEITGVPADTIIKLGEEFGTHRPAVAVGDGAPKYTADGGFTQWAIHCLNALTGNIQEKGGVYFTPYVPGFDFPELKPGPGTKEPSPLPGTGSNPDTFFDAVAGGGAGLIDTLIVIDANPLFHSRQKDKMIRALEKIENVVCLGTFVDETARYCTLFLPDHSFLEKTDTSGPIPGVIAGHVGLRQPVIKPVFNTRQSGDVLIETGRELLGTDVFPWKNYGEIVRDQFEAIYKSGEGAIISESIDSEWDKYLRDRGWKFQQYETFDAFQRLLEKSGGWWNPAVPVRSVRDMFHTPSEKFEFFSHKSEKFPVPHYGAPAEGGHSPEFPLILTVSQLLTNRDGKGASQPSMMEMVGIQVGRYWKSWVEINPETAAHHGLKDRQPAWVESAKGRIQAEVRFFQGILPGVVHMHLGLGHTSYGRFGTGIGVNVTDIIENSFDSLAHIPALNGTPVKVSRVKPGG